MLEDTHWFRLSHILWESIPAYYGKTFPQNEGILSLAVGNLFPQYVGLIHSIWKQAKRNTWFYLCNTSFRHTTLWEIPRNTMRIRSVLSKNRGCFMRNAVFKSVSHNISAWLSFVYWKLWEYEKRKWKIVCRKSASFLCNDIR